MKLVVQRVKRGSVSIDGKIVGKIARGLVVLAGMEKGDGLEELQYLCSKLIGLRIFGDSEGKMNLSIQDIGGEILLVSQFTLLGDCKKGNRPSFDKAMPPAEAEPLYNEFKDMLKKQGIKVEEAGSGQ